MNLSPEGLAFIKANESCSLTRYQDPPGSASYSIGWGHWLGMSSTTMSITQEQADALLEADLRVYVACVNARVQPELTQGQFDALVDFVYNEGIGAFINSTLLEMLNRGDFAGAADQLTRWNKVEEGGALVVSQALAERRAAERKMFLADSPTVPDLPAA